MNLDHDHRNILTSVAFQLHLFDLCGLNRLLIERNTFEFSAAGLRRLDEHRFDPGDLSNYKLVTRDQQVHVYDYGNDEYALCQLSNQYELPLLDFSLPDDFVEDSTNNERSHYGYHKKAKARRV